MEVFTRSLQSRTIAARTFRLAVLLLVFGGIAHAVEHSGGKPSYFNLSPSEFRQTAQAQEPLAPDTLQPDVLAAAIFHETNLRRQHHQLLALEFHPRVQEAAEVQSRLMADDEEVRHENPGEEGAETLSDRLQSAGLKPAFAAENVASAFMVQYESGQPFYRRLENGELILSRQPDGPPIPPHTYLSFAEALLDQWMKSPSHRKNILQEKPRYLGTAAQPRREKTGMWLLYCTQVFFTPLP